jgi:hypothetical protein
VPVLLFNGFVALAGAFAQTFNINDFDFAARVFDHPSFLKSASYGGHARASDAKHFSQKFLCKRKMIAARQVAGSQQPPAKAGINFMMGHAGR